MPPLCRAAAVAPPPSHPRARERLRRHSCANGEGHAAAKMGAGGAGRPVVRVLRGRRHAVIVASPVSCRRRVVPPPSLCRRSGAVPPPSQGEAAPPWLGDRRRPRCRRDGGRSPRRPRAAMPSSCYPRRVVAVVPPPSSRGEAVRPSGVCSVANPGKAPRASMCRAQDTQLFTHSFASFVLARGKRCRPGQAGGRPCRHKAGGRTCRLRPAAHAVAAGGTPPRIVVTVRTRDLAVIAARKPTPQSPIALPHSRRPHLPKTHSCPFPGADEAVATPQKGCKAVPPQCDR